MTVDMKTAAVVRRRDGFLDGLRGLAALYVVAHHAYLEVGRVPATPVVRAIGSVFEFGRASVAVFIVLSGYCLSLAVARSKNLDVGGLQRYFARRAWRILPPYYAALLVSLVACLVVPGLNRRTGGHWDITLPVGPGAVLAHLGLFHNGSEASAYKVNHALWSVATECQIYVLFPLVLLPAVRWLGTAAVTVLACVLGAACHYMLPSLDAARPWYLGLFCIGMSAALAGAASNREPTAVRRSWGWWSAGWAAVTVLTAFTATTRVLRPHPWVVDFAVGATTGTLILHCRATAAHGRSAAAAVLEHSWASQLGTISYSLYLIHPPVVAIVGLWVRTDITGEMPRLVLGVVVGVVASVAAGAFFFAGVERHFLPVPVTPRPATPQPVGPPVVAPQQQRRRAA